MAAAAFTTAFSGGGGVDVSVLFFFGCGFADGHDFDGEIEVFVGEGVVTIDVDGVVGDFLDGEDLLASLAVFGVEMDAFFEIAAEVGERFTGNFADELFIVGAVAVFGGDFDFYFIADGFAGECFFEAGDDVSSTVEVAEGVFAIAGVDNLPVVAFERVVNIDHVAFGSFHM